MSQSARHYSVSFLLDDEVLYTDFHLREVVCLDNNTDVALGHAVLPGSFGCGDCSSYSDTFVGGIGELYNGIKDSGAKFTGAVETDGYTFDDSEAVIDGKFIGLPLDDINEDDKTDTRIEAWINAISSEL